MTDNKAKNSDLVQVTLKKPHAHGGRGYQAGDVVKLRPDQVKRLEERGKV